MVDFTRIDGKDFGDIKLFALSTCGWCKRTKKYLDDIGAAYSYIYVDQLHGDDRREALEMLRRYDSTESFPTVALGDNQCVVGFDKKKLDQLIGV